MKKVHLNQINIGIRYIKLVFIYLIAFLFTNCNDSSFSPSWYTTINLPLTSSEILFSDIVSNCEYSDESSCNSDLSNQCIWQLDENYPSNGNCLNNLFSFTTPDSIITFLFENTIIEEGELGLTADEIFKTELIEIQDLYSFENELDISDLSSLSNISKSLEIDIYELLSNNIPNSLSCIPKGSIEPIIESVLSDNSINEIIPLPLESINNYFNPYQYLTMNQFYISKDYENTSSINIELQIQISGEDEIYNETITQNVNDPGTLYDDDNYNLINNVTVLVHPQLSEIQNYCTIEIPMDSFGNQNECESEGYVWQSIYICSDPNFLNQNECENQGSIWGALPASCIDMQDGFLIEENDAISFDFSFYDINVESITGALVIPLDSQNESIDLPSFGDGDLSFELRGAKINSNLENTVNQLSISYSNNSDVSVNFDILFENFEDSFGNVLTESFTIEQGSDTKIVRLENYLFLHPDNVGLEESEYNTNEIESLSYRINFIDQEIKTHFLNELEDNQSMSISIEGIQIQPLEFEYLMAAVEELTIQTPTVEFDDIPSGFEGLIFANPIMEMNISNEIGIGSQIQMNLLGVNDSQDEFELNIIGEVFELNNQEDQLASSCLRVVDDCVCSFRGTCEEFDNEVDCNECQILSINDSLNFRYNSTNISLSEFLTQGPATLSVTEESKAILKGVGKLYANTYVWGDFSLIAPFSIIIGESEVSDVFEDLYLMPSEPTEISEIDQSSKELIDNALIEASIISNIENNSFIIGNTSIIISSNLDFFPINIDSYIAQLDSCNNIEFSDNNNIGYCNNDIVIHQIISSINNNFLNSIQDLITNIRFILTDDNKIKLIEFLNVEGAILLEYGKLIEFILPGPENENDQPPFILNNFSSSMDSLQFNMINQSENQKYINTIITLQNSYDLNNDGFIDGDGDGIINLYNNDYIDIKSYISFLVNPSEF